MFYALHAQVVEGRVTDEEGTGLLGANVLVKGTLNGTITDFDGNFSLAVSAEDKVSAGSYQPDLRVGFYNTLTYGNVSLGLLFDGQIGGRIYSSTHALMNTGGTIR